MPDPILANPQTIPAAMTIAGSDCSAGAGLQADLKTFHSLGVYGLSAVTCVVSEIPGRVEKIEPVSPEMLESQIRILMKGFPIAGIKTGMLFSAEHIEATTTALGDGDVPLVLDPVMVATSGDPLMLPNAIDAYESLLFPKATLLTPNMDEAAVLMRLPDGEKVTDLKAAAETLSAKYGTAVLVKGGHLETGIAEDWLAHSGGLESFSAPYIEGVNTHGTGCTYSAAITAGLAKGVTLVDAIREGKAFVTCAIRDHYQWENGVHALNHSRSKRKIVLSE